MPVEAMSNVPTPRPEVARKPAVEGRDSPSAARFRNQMKEAMAQRDAQQAGQEEAADGLPSDATLTSASSLHERHPTKVAAEALASGVPVAPDSNTAATNPPLDSSGEDASDGASKRAAVAETKPTLDGTPSAEVLRSNALQETTHGSTKNAASGIEALATTGAQRGDSATATPAELAPVASSGPEVVSEPGAPLRLQSPRATAQELVQRIEALGDQLLQLYPTQIKMRLDPPTLGDMLVSVRLQHGQVQLAIETSQAEAARELEATLHLLRQEFGVQGIQLGSLDVRTQADDPNGFGWQQTFDGHDAPTGQNAHRDADHAREFDSVETVPDNSVAAPASPDSSPPTGVRAIL